MNPRPTLRDVAAKAGLSVTQVSRALNGHNDVADATKVHVGRVAAELNYAPNLEARRLKNPHARTGKIGIILPSESLRFSDPFFGDLLTAVVAEASAAGIQLSLSTHPADTHETDPYRVAIRRKQVDGFILLRTTTRDARVAALLEAQVPFVSLGRSLGTAGYGAVGVDEGCFEPVVDHLLDLGHRRIACIAEPARYALGAARLSAFRAAAQRRGLVLEEGDVIESGFHERAGRDAALSLLRRPERPTAIVAMNDLLALGVLQAAARSGVAVPAALSVVGFDDIRAARQVEPALTTVRQPASEIGQAVVRLLLPAIESGRPDHADHRVATSLVIRGSSGRAVDSRR